MCRVLRIVKMSSPNLNILTLLGSLLTYSSGFLFAVDERTHWHGGASSAVIQVSPHTTSASVLHHFVG